MVVRRQIRVGFEFSIADRDIERIAQQLGNAIVAPVVAYLMTEELPDTDSIFIVGGGKVQRTALFQNEGITFGDVPSVDDVAAKWGEITDLSAAKAASFTLG